MAITKEYIYSTTPTTAVSNICTFLQQYAAEYFDSISLSEDGTTVNCYVDGTVFVTIGSTGGMAKLTVNTQSYNSTSPWTYCYACDGGVLLSNNNGVALTITKDSDGDTAVIVAGGLTATTTGTSIVVYVAAASSPSVGQITVPYHKSADGLTVITPFVVPKAMAAFTPTVSILTYSQHVSGTGSATLDIDGTDWLSTGLWAVKDSANGGSGSADMSAYALKAEVSTEAKNRIAADTALQAQIDALHGDAGTGSSTLGYTRKNFLQTKPLTFSKHGITATVNADGTITLDGTNTNSGAFILLTNIRAGGIETAQEFDNYRLLPAGEYILSGGASDGGAKIQLRLAEEPNSIGDVYYSTPADGGEVRFTVTEAQKYSYTKLYIAKEATFDNVTICPMIRDARISDDSYEPYRQSVEERLAALEALMAAQAATE